MKPITFVGDTLDRIRAFPDEARREGGHQLDRVQRGLDPNAWKPMKTVGPGVREIRIRESTGAFRIIYAATFKDAVYVLHAFQKTSQKTAKHDLDVAASRFRQLRQTAE